MQTCRILWTDLAAGMADEVLDGRLLASLDSNELESVRATLLQAYNLAFEVCFIKIMKHLLSWRFYYFRLAVQAFPAPLKAVTAVLELDLLPTRDVILSPLTCAG